MEINLLDFLSKDKEQREEILEQVREVGSTKLTLESMALPDNAHEPEFWLDQESRFKRVFGQETEMKFSRLCDCCTQSIPLTSKDTQHTCTRCKLNFDVCSQCVVFHAQWTQCPRGFGCCNEKIAEIRIPFTQEAPGKLIGENT